VRIAQSLSTPRAGGNAQEYPLFTSGKILVWISAFGDAEPSSGPASINGWVVKLETISGCSQKR
jgi:hypothetical protein